jgi:uncharacterized protein (TIGR02145 family)
MADLKIGDILPSVGDIKVGIQNVSRIYTGTTRVWPPTTPPGDGEVLIGNLVWKNSNHNIIEDGLSLATSAAEATFYMNSNTPACLYWFFDTTNVARGLYYNQKAAELIVPPPGFRLPTLDDWVNLQQATIDNFGHSTAICGGDANFWPATTQSKPSFGQSGFNSLGAGFAYINESAIGFSSQGTSDFYRTETGALDRGFRRQSDNEVTIVQETWSKQYQFIRFCRDY